jgi:hypothetical protein
MSRTVSSIPVSIDYTSRDYYSLREDLITLVKNRINSGTSEQWTGEDPSDFGVALIEAFSYVGDVVNYYLDRVANESYLPTATQRKNVLNLARQFGYQPTGYRAAELEITFTNESSTTAYTIPTGTQIRGTVLCDDVVEELIFTTLATAVVEAGSTAVVLARHGQAAATLTGNDPVYGETLGQSTGAASQRFALSSNQTVMNSIEVYVDNGGDTFSPWRKVSQITDFGPAAAVYETVTDENNFEYILFGDGISGAVPPSGSEIRANYSIGGGTVGNISAEILSEIYFIPNTDTNTFNDIIANVTATNSTAGVGGVDPEDSFSIRRNAPLALRSITRAVTLEDYATLALSQPTVGKANADAEIWTSVTLYVAPVRNADDTELYPGYTLNGETLTAEWDFIESSLSAYLQDKIQIGTSVQIAPPNYTDVSVAITAVPAEGYTFAQTEAEIREQFLLQYSYLGTDFGQVIIPEVIERDINTLASVRVAKVTALYTGETSQRTALVGEPGQIFVFANANLNVTQPSSNASLTALASSSGTLNPTFVSDFYVYNIAVANAVDEITLTPTPATGATVTVNGTSAATAVSLDVGTNAISVIVTASDGITVKVYTVIVTRAAA